MTAIATESAISEIPAMTKQEFYEKYKAKVRSIARKEHKGSALHDVEDIENATWAKLYEAFDRLSKTNEGQVVKVAGQEARKWCERERQSYMEFSGNYVYNPKMVAVLLSQNSFVLLEECKDVAGRIDLRNALVELSRRKPAQAHALFKLHADNYEYKELSSSEKRNAEYGHEFIAYWLNNNQPKTFVDMHEDSAAIEGANPRTWRL